MNDVRLSTEMSNGGGNQKLIYCVISPFCSASNLFNQSGCRDGAALSRDRRQ